MNWLSNLKPLSNDAVKRVASTDLDVETSAWLDVVAERTNSNRSQIIRALLQEAAASWAQNEADQLKVIKAERAIAKARKIALKRLSNYIWSHGQYSLRMPEDKVWEFLVNHGQTDEHLSTLNSYQLGALLTKYVPGIEHANVSRGALNNHTFKFIGDV